MLSALRALVVATPAILVLASIFFMSRDAELATPRSADECTENDCATLNTPTTEDQIRVHRLALKTETAIDMLDGRLTVEEAADRFLELSSSDPESLDNMRHGCDGATDEEKALEQLLSFARVQAIRQPDRYAAALALAERWAKSNERVRTTH